MRTQKAVDSMSDGQFAVLAGLSIHGPHTLGDLADRERVSAPSMNRTVNCLEESGYLTRTVDEGDRRNGHQLLHHTHDFSFSRPGRVAAATRGNARDSPARKRHRAVDTRG
jgi:DNA-binding IclR family transcriptional regulator